MSHSYEMQLEVYGFKIDRVKEVKAAAVTNWPEWDTTIEASVDGEAETYLEATASGQLYGGEADFEFAERVQQDIWTANGAYCRISVVATDMENIPFQRFEPDETDFEEWRNRQESGGNL